MFNTKLTWWDKVEIFIWYRGIKRLWDFVTDIPREIKWFYQRGTRGWADKDTWGFDHYLSKVISGGLNHLANKSIGHPSSFSTCDYDSNIENACEICMEKNNVKECPDLLRWKEALNRLSKEFSNYDNDDLSTEFYKGRETIFEDGELKNNPEITKEEWEEYLRKSKKQMDDFDDVLKEFIKYYRNYWD